MAYINKYSKGGISLSIDTSNSTDNTFIVTFPISYTTSNSSYNKNNDVYDLYTSMITTKEIENILDMPLEDLPLTINKDLSELSKRILALRCSFMNQTYDIIELLEELTEIENILDMPLEDLPLTINKDLSKLSKRILALRLKVHI